MEEKELLAKRQQEQARGREARRLLEHPILVEAFTKLETACSSAWRNSKLGDAQAREKLYLMLSALAEVKAHLTHILETGKLADIDLAKFEAEREKPT